jgi:hypothetical protein
MYDILMEDGENQEPKKEFEFNDSKVDFEEAIFKISKDFSSLDFRIENAEAKCAISSSSSHEGNLRILPDFRLDGGAQISPTCMFDIFVHIYNLGIKHGLHLFTNEAIGNGKMSMSMPDVDYPIEGFRTYDNGSFNFNLREVIPSQVAKTLMTELDMKFLFGHGQTIQENIFDVPKQEVKSFNDLNSFQRQAIRNTLVIPENLIAKFSDNFDEERLRSVKRGKVILKALSKGMYKGKPYVLRMGMGNGIYLYSTSKYDYNPATLIDPRTNTIIPDYSISLTASFESYDGKPLTATDDWDLYREIKDHLKKQFAKYEIDFS